MYTHLELHLAAVPLSRKHAKAIRDCGGKANGLRSHYDHRRYVTLPATESKLFDELVRAYPNGPRTTVVARGGDASKEPFWVVVQTVPAAKDCSPSVLFAKDYARAHAQAVKRGILLSDEQKAWDRMHAMASAENATRNRHIHLEVMRNALELYLVHTGMDKQLFWEQRACAEKYLKQYQEGRVL
jgi:hypothetical protein